MINLTQNLASTGFSDTTRVGSGNPKLGLDLAMNNKDNLLNALNVFKNNIDQFESLIKIMTGNYFIKSFPMQKK